MTLPTRADAIRSANALLSDPRTVFLKVETTGIGPRDEVVEIAIIHAVTGDVLLNSLVKPSFRYPMHDKLKHGLTYDMLAEAPLATELYLHVALQGKKVIVYGKDFARKMIGQSYAAQGGVFMPNEGRDHDVTWHCAMTLYGAYEGVMSAYGNDYKWWKFDDALDNLHINNEKRNHRALEEAKTIGLLLYQIGQAADAVKVKRDPLPRPSLSELRDDKLYYRDEHDAKAAFAAMGYPDSNDIEALEKESGKPFNPSDYYANSYPDNEDEFDSFDDYNG